MNDEDYNDQNIDDNSTIEDTDFDIYDTDDEEIEDLYDEEDVYDTGESQRFGEKEHNAAKDEKGHYDRNYYANRQKELDEEADAAKKEKDRNWKMNDGSEGEPVKADGSNTSHKSAIDKANDRINYAKAKKNQIGNKIANAKNKAYMATHPGELAKEKVKEVGDNLKDKVKSKLGIPKDAKDAVKKVSINVGKSILTFLKSPYGIIIVSAAIFFVFIIFIFLMFFYDDNKNKNNSSLGYFDSACNFNETMVNFNSCSIDSTNSITSSLTIKDYVIGSTYAYSNNENLNDEQLKALMIIIKTNALSLGGYNSSRKDIELDDCNMSYQSLSSEDSNYEKLSTIYDTISNYLYISESYNSAINSLNNSNKLELDFNIIEKIKNDTSETYQQILNAVYSNGDIEEDDNTTQVYRDSLFLGDSRMQGMLLSGVINNNNTVYGVGYGYNWLIGNGTFSSSNTNATSGGIEGINSKMREGASYNIIIWLGVNDYTYISAQKYFDEFKDLALKMWPNHFIYIVSVGPVKDSLAKYVSNEGINNFNNEMASLIIDSNISNLKYIDLNFTEESITSYDSEGLHYSNSDYKNIYNIINSNIENKISNNLTLYDLNNFCTYYSLTENDAFWWPIGSLEATQGNIYGGSPSTTYISSKFGWRVINGTKSYHQGIDIAGDCESNVVIAAKDGKVVKINDECPSMGSLGSSCGGGYGNYIKIEHDNGIETVYAHLYLNSLTVKEGDSVKQGQKIALIGSSGSSTGCHLHFEVRNNGTKVDPLEYVSSDNPRPTNSFNITDFETGKDGKQNVCLALMSSGLSKNAVIGIMINLNQESAFKSTNLENCYEEGNCCKSAKGNSYGYCAHPEIKGFGSDSAYTNGVDSGAYKKEYFVNDHAGYGLVQWTTSDRKAKLYDYAKNLNASIGSVKAQLGYMLDEELPLYPTTYKYVTGNYSASEIALNYCLNYEAPNNKEVHCPQRVNNYLESFTNYVENNCN